MIAVYLLFSKSLYCIVKHRCHTSFRRGLLMTLAQTDCVVGVINPYWDCGRCSSTHVVCQVVGCFIVAAFLPRWRGGATEDTAHSCSSVFSEACCFAVTIDSVVCLLLFFNCTCKDLILQLKRRLVI